MPGEAVVVIDSDDSPKIEVESTKKELKKLADARVAKDFFTAFYNNPLTERSSKTGRKITLHKGTTKEDSSTKTKTDGLLEPKKPAYPRNHPKQRLLDLNIARIQVETLICPDILGHSSFDRAIKGADSALKWPKRDTITRRLLPGIYKKLETKVLDLLKSATAIAINCDIWSSKRQRGYLGVSAHYIDETFKLQHGLLACSRFSGIHNANQILDLTVEVLTKFEIENKVCYIGTDNGANIVNAFKDWFPGFIDLHDPNKFDTDMEDVFHQVIYGDEELELEPIDAEDLDTSSPLAEEVTEKLIQRYELMPDRNILVRCVAHTLQLCLKTPVKNCKMLKNSVEKLASVVAKLKKSTQGTEYVEKELGMALEARCATR
ncbi:hypothetical protein RvY_16541 [Ramazzottius varieornatus]|uniref:DUF659 domain-containing protein n=1 Tax=Ramazzottius varieornatus TaxID=947166 RepID=A0A1D1VYU0_RAMVA|nr:hypothetical protein RvY_16541 [Ramazzottius varieornatus]